MSTSQYAPIKEFSLGIYDGPHATPPEATEGPVFLGIKNVTQDGRLDLSEIRYVSEQDFPRWTKRVVPQENDIVFSYEATLHRYVVIPDGFRGCLGRRMALIRPDQTKVNPRYLHYYFLTQSWRAKVESIVINGATVDRIPLTNFPDIELEVPPLDTQQHISDTLGAYDDLIENNRRRIHLLEQAARLLYKEWFVHLRFPGHEHVRIKDGVPDGWEKKSAFDVMEVLSGGTPKTKIADYWNGNIPFFTPKDAKEYAYVRNTEKSITENGLNKCNSKLYPKDTIFITARGTVGKINLAQTDMAMNQSCYALVAKPPLDQYFLYFALIESVEQFRTRAVGAVFDAIIVDTFKLIPFIIPGEQLIETFTEYAFPILRQIDLLSTKNMKLIEARNILLPRLMNGEIAV